jgi:hypothetical protein
MLRRIPGFMTLGVTLPTNFRFALKTSWDAICLGDEGAEFDPRIRFVSGAHIYGLVLLAEAYFVGTRAVPLCQ